MTTLQFDYPENKLISIVR